MLWITFVIVLTSKMLVVANGYAVIRNDKIWGMMVMRKWIWLVLAGFMFQFGAMVDAKTTGLVVREDLGKYFAGFDSGTFIMYDTAKARYLIYNEPQSKVRLSPCSTFKIYNSLAGLETGVLDREDVYTLFKWNGTQYSFPSWNRDQTLASATRDSKRGETPSEQVGP